MVNAQFSNWITASEGGRTEGEGLPDAPTEENENRDHEQRNFGGKGQVSLTKKKEKGGTERRTLN
jgi:hypothetical protein